MNDRLFSLSKRPTCEGGVFTTCMSVPRVQFVLLFLLTLFLSTIQLDDGGLAAFDECFYAQKAKEIVISGDWLTQTYAGEIDHQNPWLHMWVMAASYELFGVSEWSARFPTSVETILIVLLTYLLVQWLTRMPWVSMISASSLLLSEYFFKYSKKAHTDHLMALFFLTAMIGYIAGRRRHQGWYLLTGLSIGLAMLTKSVLGLMPAIVVFAHILLAREWTVLKRPLFWLSMVLAIVVGCSWYAYEYAQFGDEFVHQHFEWQVLSRSVYRDVSEGGFSLGSFLIGRIGHLYAFMKDAHIWLVMAVLGLVLAFSRRGNEEPRREGAPGERLLLALWLLVPLVLVSFASDFKGWYLMPLFVPMAILSAFFLARVLGSPARLRVVNLVVLSLLFLHLAVLTVTPIFTLDLGHDIRHPGIRKLATKVRMMGPRVTERVIFFPATREMAERYGMNDYMSDYFVFALPWNFYSDHPMAGRGERTDLDEVRESLTGKSAVCLTTAEGYEIISGNGRLPFDVIGRAVEGDREYVLCCGRRNHDAWRAVIETDFSRPPLYSLRDY